MSHFLDRLTFLRKNVGTFSNDHGVVTNEDRSWEDGYRGRWSHDKIVRSTHGVNCTGSCSWKVYVKGGIVTWETQQTDYPRTRPDLPDHEPRGCARGASYSWYLYSGNRVKYPLVRSRLLKLWREARVLMTPVATFVTLIVTSGMTAPELSCTVPTMLPFSYCARATPGTMARHTSASTRKLSFLRIGPKLLRLCVSEMR